MMHTWRSGGRRRAPSLLTGGAARGTESAGGGEGDEAQQGAGWSCCCDGCWRAGWSRAVGGRESMLNCEENDGPLRSKAQALAGCPRRARGATGWRALVVVMMTGVDWPV